MVVGGAAVVDPELLAGSEAGAGAGAGVLGGARGAGAVSGAEGTGTSGDGFVNVYGGINPCLMISA